MIMRQKIKGRGTKAVKTHTTMMAVGELWSKGPRVFGEVSGGPFGAGVGDMVVYDIRAAASTPRPPMHSNRQLRENEDAQTSSRPQQSNDTNRIGREVQTMRDDKAF